MEIIVKYCSLIQTFSFNTINMLLIDRVRGAHILMNCVMNQTKDFTQDETEKWAKLAPFVETALMCVASCLRLNRSVAPFIKDSKKYFMYILKIMKSNIKN